jgi:hypothetical protein
MWYPRHLTTLGASTVSYKEKEKVTGKLKLEATEITNGD